ncbi:hypothetical protein [Salmonirosea aquatica]|uniref:Uncharacterized protein n=1 Tax=Salmonirosea aquatica TaxID=2654236 RepID=A0A7C9FP86_9BACT|nr:hypothetical protein [Cytophagaceae bacterium SJW1-29]
MKHYDFEYTKMFTKKKGTAELDDTYLLLHLDGEEKHFQFGEVVSYQVEYYNGVTLRLKMADKSRFKLIANANFCNAEPFGNFCESFEGTLARYAREHQGTLVRKPSIFEQKWVLWFLIAGTLAIAWIIVRSLSAGQGVSNALVPMGLFAMLWAAWFNTQKKRKEALSEE